MNETKFPQRILGVDPGLNVTGYGVLEVAADGRTTLCEAGVVRGTARGSLAERVRQIHDGLRDVIEALAPHAMALEEIYSHYDRPKTAILMGHARGVICLAAAEAGVPTFHYSATQIKKTLTGAGRSPKGQMQRAVQLELKLGKPPEPHDVADALAAALCHRHLGPVHAILRQARVS